MKNLLYLSVLFFISFGISSFTLNHDFTEKKVKWYSWEEAVQLNENSPKPFLVDIYTDWCGWCKKMDKSTFEDEKVAAYLNKNYYPVKLNAEQKEDINWKGVAFKYVAPPEGKRRGYHTLAASLTEGQLSYPTFVYLNPKFERIMISPGYKDAEGLLPELVFAAEGFYSTTTWEEFKKQFGQTQPVEAPKVDVAPPIEKEAKSTEVQEVTEIKKDEQPVKKEKSSKKKKQ